MAIEIERKFLPADDGWRLMATESTPYRQGYLTTGDGLTVRVRIAGSQGYLTVKGPGSGASRIEYEYPIPVDDAAAMLEQFCRKPLIEKIRHQVEHHGFTWEVDEFFGDNEGLVVAEIELQSEGQPFDRPTWVGREVTGDPRYFNAQLARSPYNRWPDSGQSG